MNIKINTEFIKLDQFLKWCGVAYSGGDADQMIANGQVLVNGETEKRRGKKLRPGDTVSVSGKKYTVE